jgi:NADPH:quinone reductase-like Zn-dependent oxidoreductase
VRAFVLTRYGGPDVLRIAEVATPEPRANEVRVRVQTIGINFAEILSRRGLYGWAPKLPYVLGMEAFGVIDAVGSEVTSHVAGAPVLVGTKFGTYADFLCVAADRALPVPHGFTPAQSAAFAVNYLTAWIGLMELARLRPTDTLLVTSAAGGVGSAAVQLASRFGANVVGIASPGKQDFVRSLGASTALDYDDEFPAADVILEMTGGPAYRKAVHNLAPMGRIVVAGASDAFPRTRNPFARIAALRNLPRTNVFDMLRRSYGVMSFHGGWLLESGSVARAFQDLVAFTEQHAITPAVSHELAFEEMADAHRVLEERRNLGKVVVHTT